MNKLKVWNKKNDYFKKQIKKPLLSTVAFFNFLNKFGLLEKDYLIDAGCGNGANLAFIVKNYQLMILIKSHLAILELTQ